MVTKRIPSSHKTIYEQILVAHGIILEQKPISKEESAHEESLRAHAELDSPCTPEELEKRNQRYHELQKLWQKKWGKNISITENIKSALPKRGKSLYH